MIKHQIFKTTNIHFTIIVSKCFILKQNNTYLVLSPFGKCLSLREYLEKFHFKRFF